MSNATVVGSGPIAFTTKEGQALSIPLTALVFNGDKIEFKDSNYPAKIQVQPWLDYLVGIDELKAGNNPPPKPAISIEAVNPGEVGNNIQVEFTPKTGTTPATFDAIITAREIYHLSFDSASLSFIANKLTLSTLVHVKGTPNAVKPKEGRYKLEGGNPTTKSSKGIDQDPAVSTTDFAFTLKAKNNGDDGNSISIEIANVDATAKTYTLTAIWKPTFTGIKLADLPAKLQGSQDVIVVKKPEGTTTFVIPDPGIVVLNGGTEQKDAVKATATAFTS